MHQVSCPRTQWWDLTNMESHCQPWIRAMAEITTVQCHGDQKMKISHPVQLGAHRMSWTIINRYYCGDGLQHYGFPITYSVAPNSWDILRWEGWEISPFPTGATLRNIPKKISGRDGKELSKKPAFWAIEMGIARTHQNQVYVKAHLRQYLTGPLMPAVCVACGGRRLGWKKLLFFTLCLCQNSYWKWPFMVSFPIKHGDFP